MHKLSKISHRLGNLFFALILALGVALIFLRVFGCKVLAVYTGSMGESCPVGSLVITYNSPPEDISEGDIISYVANEKLAVVTHRVVSVDSEKRRYVTKGDANKSNDTAPVSFDNLIGKVKIVIPKLGYAVIWAQTTGGKAVIALSLSLVAVCIAGGEIYKKGERGGNNGSDEKNEKNERDTS
jgi:signal peptidase I